MRFRTLIALCVHIVLAATLSVYMVFFHVDSSVKELMDSDIRIVIDSQEEFDQAIQSDGRIYAPTMFTSTFLARYSRRKP